YQRLHERADNLRREKDARATELHNRLGAIPEVSALELLAAENAVQDADQARPPASEEGERLQELEFQAKRGLEARNQLEETCARLRDTEVLLADAADIERDAARLRELQAVLPGVKTALEQQRGIDDATRQLAWLDEQQQKIEQDLARADEELHKGR